MRGQRGVTENLPSTGEDQSEQCPEPRGRAGRNADGAWLGYRSGIASETGYYQPDRIVPVHGAAGGAQCKTLARRRSAAALDRHRTLGSREKVSQRQRLSRTLVAEGTLESVAYSAEGGPGRSRLSTAVRVRLAERHSIEVSVNSLAGKSVNIRRSAGSYIG